MRYGAFRRTLAILLVFLSLLPAMPAGAQQSEADVFVAQAILAYEAKRYEEALGYLNEAVAQDPKHMEAYYYLGLVNIALLRLDAAVKALDLARELPPADFSVSYLLAVAYLAPAASDQ